jgi:hypothetical protein
MNKSIQYSLFVLYLFQDMSIQLNYLNYKYVKHILLCVLTIQCIAYQYLRTRWLNFNFTHFLVSCFQKGAEWMENASSGRKSYHWWMISHFYLRSLFHTISYALFKRTIDFLWDWNKCTLRSLLNKKQTIFKN